MIWRRENKIHDFKEFSKLPREQMAKVFEERAKSLFKNVISDELVQNYVAY